MNITKINTFLRVGKEEGRGYHGFISHTDFEVPAECRVMWNRQVSVDIWVTKLGAMVGATAKDSYSSN